MKKDKLTKEQRTKPAIKVEAHDQNTTPRTKNKFKNKEQNQETNNKRQKTKNTQ